ncbi:hypothetical protein COP2_035349 [Malus domestica]
MQLCLAKHPMDVNGARMINFHPKMMRSQSMLVVVEKFGDDNNDQLNLIQTASKHVAVHRFVRISFVELEWRARLANRTNINEQISSSSEAI